jgi:hypothetical protein
MKKVTITLPADDLEPTLRKYAFEAARYSAWCDHIQPYRTYMGPGPGYGSRLTAQEVKAEWREKFLRGKRIVEAFGIEYEQTSEDETVYISYPHMKGEKRERVNVGGLMAFTRVSGGTADFKKPEITFRGGVHEEACNQAAERVIRKWRASLK